MWSRPISFVNARVHADGVLAASIRFGARIESIGQAPRRGDLVLDLDGAFVLPGLVNAHDHLELNHYGRVKFREAYGNAREWIDDVRPRLVDDPALSRGRALPLADRLFIGGLKNLLAGVTTVAHHNPLYRELWYGFPVRLVRRFGWAHSFLLERGPVGARGQHGGDVAERYRRTRRDAPFILHLAEGVDASARDELERLDRLGCLRSNSVLVHGVALTPTDWTHLCARGAGLVWCPASNLFLFGRTAPVREFIEIAPGSATRIGLGTDSRLTGSRDLLDELRVAASAAPLAPADILRMVTTNAADLLRLPRAGRLAPGAPADLIVIPAAGDDPGRSLLAATRRDVALVALGGRPLVGDRSLADAFVARGGRARVMRVDGAPKVAADRLVRRLARCSIREPGVECEA